MPSSISSSDASHVAEAPLRAKVPLWASFALVGAIVVLLVVMELLARLMVPSLSRIEGRIVTEYRQALGIRHGRNGVATALVIGNSLMGDGVDFKPLQRTLADNGVNAQRLLVEGTAYLDWYHGLGRLIDAGVRPDAFVLMISFEQLIGKEFRGAYSAHRLLRLQDIPTVAGELGLGNTETSGLVISRLSAYYGLREELRKQVLFKLIPDLSTLTVKLTAARSSDERARYGNVALAVERLTAMRRRVEAAGSRLIFVEPPAPVPNAAAMKERIDAAARLAGVRMLVPVRHDELGKEFYRDGYHLNERGSAFFTPRLAALLSESMGQQPPLRN
ncbi:MAG: hypothetical protein SFW09_16885 [Hyphomicrobiaceae bacterium]|nr:hypothetical protein [Hyphomicrobiaceae bacterium]